MSQYLPDVQKYDAGADPTIVNKIVKHLGIALRARDSSLVACANEIERGRVREKWCQKKLGVIDKAAGEEVIAKVCQQMSADNAKSRVTFYYLVAKHLGKLNDL